MAPGLIIDNTPDLDFTPFPTKSLPPKLGPTTTQQRTLLLAAPSLASNEASLRAAIAGHDRSTSDLHMLDRLSAGLVNLPASTYDLVLVLSDDASLLDRGVLTRVHDALKPGGKVRARDGVEIGGEAEKEFVLAGLVRSSGENGFEKPDYGSEAVVPLRLRRKKKPVVVEKVEEVKKVPSGVGFVNLDDLDGDDDDLIDEDTLLTDQDLKRPLNIRMFSPSPSPISSSLSHCRSFPSSSSQNSNPSLSQQPPNASPKLANAAAHAKTAPAASPNASQPKKPTAKPPPTPSSANKSSSWASTTSPRSTSPSRARSGPAGTAPSATRLGVMAVLILGCRLLSLGRRLGY